MMSIKEEVIKRITHGAFNQVWTPYDFLDLASRDAIDKALQRLEKSGDIRRIDRGLYHRACLNTLTGKVTAADYQSIIEAIVRRDQGRMLVDGLTSANDIGLTNAVSGQVNILTDLRLKSVHCGSLTINFKQVAPSKLHWANKPGMRVVQALHWLRDVVAHGDQKEIHNLKEKLIAYLNNPERKLIVDDLQKGLATLPGWMQKFLREVISDLD